MGTYCNETDVEAITQFAISESTAPTTAQVASWIAQIEVDADARALGTTTLTDQVVDVRTGLGSLPKDSMAALRAIAGGEAENFNAGNIMTLPFTPIISITALSRRTSALGAADAWESLLEGTGSGKDYIIVKRRTKTNQYLGFALYFHDKMPYSGIQRVKATYAYGWNLNSSIIGEWCGLKVALKVLDAIINNTTPIGSNTYGMMDVSVGIDPARRRVDILSRIKELEASYFPTKKLGIALV